MGICRTLLRWGADVYVEPTFVSPPVPSDVAHLLTKHLAAPFDLLIQHSDPDNLGISDAAAQCSDVKVAWSMWEFGGAKPLARRTSSFAKRMRPFDLAMMYDQVAVDAWQPHGPRKLPWAVLQGGYEAGEYKYYGERDWYGERFMFIMNGQLHARKSPYVTIQAFTELKYERPGAWDAGNPEASGFDSARLGLHTTIGDPLVVFGHLIPGMKVWHEMWEKPVLEEFYRAAHVLVAPSRGEGKNLPALEMMTTGGAVAATNWGGMTQWLSPEYAYPLDYTLGPTDAAYPDGAFDAKVSVATVKEFMWHAFTHRGEVREKAELAARVIPRMCDWPAVMERFFERVRDAVPGKGEELYNKAVQCRRERGMLDDRQTV